ncbi:MAG: glycosyltransferase family 2 protein [Lachnospiraceae bacterium]|nr:glycosyltransferase family 2 protein [Lachnospiraceae bacterium]
MDRKLVKISIIVPVFNIASYVKKCIESILSQSFDEYELILVDDGSTDESLKILQDYERLNSKKIKVISQSNQGQGEARNVGIKIAKGEYLLFVDGDDYLAQEALTYLAYIVKREQADVVAFDLANVDYNGNMLGVLSGVSKEGGLKEQTVKEYLITIPPTPCKLWKKDLLLKKDIWFRSKVWYEDLEFTMKALAHVKKIYYTPMQLYFYVHRNNSTMNNKIFVEKNSDIFTVFNGIIDYYKKQGIFQIYIKEIEYLAVLHVLYYATVRVNRIDKSSTLQKEIYEYITKNFPTFKDNLYLDLLESDQRKELNYIINQRYDLLYRKYFWSRKLKDDFKQIIEERGFDFIINIYKKYKCFSIK